LLELRARRSLAEFTLDAALTAGRGEVTVIVGESGAGKSTLLRLVAGLLRPDEGRIELDGHVLADTTTGAWTPPEARPVGWVAQDLALFPHLSARENAAFGPRARGLSVREAHARADAALARFGVAALAERRPRELSGGEQQRVALARALAMAPDVLLLDEPLAALDPRTRRTVRTELRRLLEGLPCVTLLVTHDPAEALALGDRIVTIEDGRVTQADSLEEFVRHPRTRYAAEFLGLNRLEGTVVERTSEGLALVEVDGGALAVPDPGEAERVRVLVHPHAVTLSLDPPASSALNTFSGAIVELVPEPPGERIRVLLDSRPPLAATVMRTSVESMGLRRGLRVHASFKATAVEVLPA
jgi:molybdate transport system ATP-binding protein